VFGFRITNDGEYKINWRNLNDQEIQLLKNFKPKTHDLEDDFENYINSLEDIEIESDHAIELFNYYKKCFYGTSFLDDLLKDENIEEISIIEDNFVYVYVKNKGWLKTNVFVENGEFVYNLINHIAKNTNRRITLKNPRINASYKNIRIHGAIKPIVEKNSLTIRRFNKKLCYNTLLALNCISDPESFSLPHLLKRSLKNISSFSVYGLHKFLHWV